MPDLVSYCKRERAYRLQNGCPIQYAALRRAIHPLLLLAMQVYHAVQNIKIITIGHVPKIKQPIIFAVSHIGMYDVEVVLQAIRRHTYLLSGDEEAMYRTFDGGFFAANGVIWVDPEDRDDRMVAYETTVKYLRNGLNIFWCPEGTWNLTESRIILPLHNRIIEAAVAAGAVIIPIGVDQRDKEKGIDFMVNIGDPFLPEEHFTGELTQAIKNELADELRGRMARLKYDIWESADRADFDDGYYARFLEKRIQEWPFYNLDIIRTRMFNPNKTVPEKEVFAHLDTIEVGPRNAFLARVKIEFQHDHIKDIW